MNGRRFQAPRRLAAGLAVVLLALFLPAAATAGNASLDVGAGSVITVTVKGRGNEVALRTWDRPTVVVDGGDAQPEVTRSVVPFGTPGGRPLAQLIAPVRWRDAEGNDVVLPPEEFPFAGMAPGPHDVVRVTADERSRLVLTVPSSAALLFLNVGGGVTTIDGYRGANLVVWQRGGRLRVQNATTAAFVQMNTGLVTAADDSFDRIRLRTNAAHVVFERCRSRQIEASTLSGNVVYDGGSFDPGLARFESQRGSIALGVTSAAQLVGRTQDGHVYTSFERRDASVAQQGNDAVATIAGGGPLVNALSVRGNVFLYDGSLRARRTVPVEWRALHRTLDERRATPQPHPRERVRARTSAAPRRRA